MKILDIVKEIVEQLLHLATSISNEETCTLAFIAGEHFMFHPLRMTVLKKTIGKQVNMLLKACEFTRALRMRMHQPNICLSLNTSRFQAKVVEETADGHYVIDFEDSSMTNNVDAFEPFVWEEADHVQKNRFVGIDVILSAPAQSNLQLVPQKWHVGPVQLISATARHLLSVEDSIPWSHSAPEAIRFVFH